MRVKALFELGQVRVTPGVLELVDLARIASCVARHVCGDFGSIDWQTKHDNSAGLARRQAIWSAYPIDPSAPSKGYGANTIWIITERGWRVTTVLLPSER